MSFKHVALRTLYMINHFFTHTQKTCYWGKASMVRGNSQFSMKASVHT